jgi:hypothetical protein
MPIQEEPSAGLERYLRITREVIQMATTNKMKAEAKAQMQVIYGRADSSALKTARGANTRPMAAHGQHRNVSTDARSGRRK